MKLGDKLKVERELAPVGSWRRWLVVDTGADSSRLMLSLVRSRSSSGSLADLDDLELHARKAQSIVHPGCSRVVEVGRGEAGLWVLEKVAEGLPVSHSLDGDIPHGLSLTRGLVRAMDAIAYIHRHGMVHGSVSAETVFVHRRGLQLTGVATARTQQTWEAAAAAEDVRGWGIVGSRLLEQTLGPKLDEHPLADLLGRAARVGQPGPLPDGPQMAALVHQVVASPRGRASPRPTRLRRRTFPGATRGEASTMKRAAHALAAVLRGLLTTVLTLALIVAAVTGGVLWALARGPAEISVPNLIGMTRAQASERLAEMGLAEGSVRRVYRDDVGAGKVAATSPPVGMRVRHAREVSLVVSLGSAQVQVPRLVGLQVAEAEAVVRARGIKLRKDGQRRSAAPVGEVVRQDPAAAERIGRGAEVGVVISGGQDYGVLRVLGERGEEKEVLFRRLEIIVPQGESIQRVKVLEGYRSDLRVTYDRLHSRGERVKVDTYGFEGKHLEVQIEGVTVFKSRL